MTTATSVPASSSSSTNAFQVSCRVRGAGEQPSCVAVDAAQRAVSVRTSSRSSVASPSAAAAAAATAASESPCRTLAAATACSTESSNARFAASGTGAAAPTTYTCFDCVFASDASQGAVFERIGAPFVADVLAGYNCTVLAYGPTGSGKTYTTVGSARGDARGLVPRAMEQLVGAMSRIGSSAFDVSLTASFVEVYQETLRDLLLPNVATTLRIREDKDTGVFVEGASEISISSVASGMAVLARGTAQRATGATLLNADSSRSHAVFTLTFTKRCITTRETLRGKLLFVDLAGSEKASKTAASGTRLDEAKYINRSLSALGNVINALTDSSATFVPYRDSKLTRLLQSSLGGNAKTHLLLTCASSESHASETLSTLRFGARAKRIRNAPHVNNERPTTAREYKELLATLQAKLESLSCYIRQLESARCAACRSSEQRQQQQPERAHCCSCTAPSPAVKQCEDPACSSGGDSIADEEFSDSSDQLSEHQHKSEMRVSDMTRASRREAHDAAECLSSASPEQLHDDLMREELASLRRAVAAMQSGRYEAEHARVVAAAAAASASHNEREALCHTQLEQIRRQDAALADASDTIAALEHKLACLQTERTELGSVCCALRLEVKQLAQQQAQWREAESAEAEILRRQLAALSKQVKAAQLESLASQTRQRELAASLYAKEQELCRLHEETEALRQALATTQQRLAATSSAPCLPQRQSLARPLTCTSLGSSDASGYTGASSVGAIQSWWAGASELAPSSPDRDEHDQRLELPAPWLKAPGQSQHRHKHETSGRERRRANSTPLPLGLESPGRHGAALAQSSDLCVASHTSTCTNTAAAAAVVAATVSPSGSSGTSDDDERRRCPSQGQSRPFRARLVGLLTSLEEETSALKDLSPVSS